MAEHELNLPYYQLSAATSPELHTYAYVSHVLTDGAQQLAAKIRLHTASGDSLLDTSLWTHAYAEADPLLVLFTAAALVAVFCWTGSLLTRHYSWIDRLWSLLPPAYALYFVQLDAPSTSAEEPPRVDGLTGNPRLLLVTCLITAWGARLTFNYWRKGGYAFGSEDYRWHHVQASIPSWAFQLLNLVFIAAFQCWLLAAITAPVYVCWRAGFTSWSWMDVGTTAVFLAALIGETIADEQQWRFHQRKHAFEGAAGKQRRRSSDPVAVVDQDVRNGFLTAGLWRYSRHPNFFCEQAIWCAVYGFGTAATGQWVRWDVAGAALLLLLFQGSTHLTERITAAKYPAYAVYQRTTSRLAPWWPRHDRAHKADKTE